MSETITVVLATYNGAEFLGEQLTSILNQSRRPDEILIVDDGSADETLHIARGLLAQSEIEFRLLESRGNVGVAGNFARGLENAAGSLIALADQDDRWSIDKLQVLERAFAANPDLLLAHTDARLIDEVGTLIEGHLFPAVGVSNSVIDRVRHGQAFEVLMRRNIVTGATVMIRRRLVELALPVPPAWIHDEWLAVVAASHQGLATVNEPLIDYRQHGRNQIGAARLTVDSGLARLKSPRRERNDRLLRRSLSLEQRAGQLGLSCDRLELVRAKAEHERARSRLAVARVARLPGVLKILRTGGYGRFGNGIVDAVRDLVQPG